MSDFGRSLRKILVMAGVLLVLAIPLMILLEDFVREAIVTPLAYQIWLLRVVADALPQSLVISAVVAIAVFLAARSLRPGKVDVDEPRPQPRESVGTLRRWNERLSLLHERRYSRDRFDHYIGHLVTKVIAHSEHLTTREVNARLQAGSITVPDEVKSFVDAAYGPRLADRQGLFGWLRSLLLRERPKRVTLDTVTEDVSPVLDYIELQLRLNERGQTDE
jgi:hypothetical protein